MRFASCMVGDRRFAGVVDGDEVRPLDGITELGPDTELPVLRRARLSDETPLSVNEVTLRPVVPRPGKIIGVGLNYRAHVGETGRDLPSYPVLFTKFAESLIGPYCPIAKPAESSQVDYEGELAVVMGASVRRVSQENALEAVAGYTIANDITMRDYQYRTHQWLQGKSWADATPLGPALVTLDELGDPNSLDISVEVNGARRQASNTELLIFDVATLVSTITEFVPLHPGDVILTGTPGGVGYRSDPQLFLQPGDRVKVEIEAVGTLLNEVVEESV